MKLLKEKESFTFNEHVENFFNSEQNYDEVIDKLFAIKKPSWMNTFFTDGKNKIEKNVLDELDIFTNVNLFSKIDRTKTIFGRYILKKILQNPTHNLEILNNRKEFLLYLTKNKENLENINNQLTDINKLDKQFLWFWRENDEHSDFIYNMIYFQTPYLQFLNKNELYLRLSNFYKIVVSPLFVTFSPLLYIILPFILLKFMKIKIPFKVLVKMMWSGSTQMISLPFVKGDFAKMAINFLSKALSVFYYFQNVYNTITYSKNNIAIIKTLHDKVLGISKLASVTEGFMNRHETFIGKRVVDNNAAKFSTLLDDIKNSPVPTILSDKGAILSTFYNILEKKELIIPYILNLGLFDAFTSLANLYDESKNKVTRYCFPEFQKNSKKRIDIKNLWHLSLYEKENVVLNSVEFDKDKRNYIITGPNAAGKSTFIKSVLLNVYFAQTIIISNSYDMVLTPLYLISSCIRSIDEQGRESLFQAEMNKAKYYLNVLRGLEKDQHALTIFDEMFTSTNHLEGMVAAHTICEELGKIQNSMCLVTTHFTKITKISKSKKYGFNNVYFEINRDVNNKILFTYKMNYGISTQYIALELMRENGFADEFIDNALKKIKKISGREKKYITELRK
jgi:DNA mismatch repair protein MutS